ncbi:MAG: DUF4258 domain-containing protein [Dehalococcoidia bacterium]|nr:DUF4258 domain-containing protein [Dehalococcoidia bacterium]MSQ16897.1 DUF4258 domain-containing protein [Dehalococcoidia bacterium]
MREDIRTRQYVMTLHAAEELDEDGLTVFDVERAILIGEIQERQRDRVTAEWKYRVRGEAFDGSAVDVIAKISLMGKLVIITAYTL